MVILLDVAMAPSAVDPAERAENDQDEPRRAGRAGVQVAERLSKLGACLAITLSARRASPRHGLSRPATAVLKLIVPGLARTPREESVREVVRAVPPWNSVPRRCTAVEHFPVRCDGLALEVIVRHRDCSCDPCHRCRRWTNHWVPTVLGALAMPRRGVLEVWATMLLPILAVLAAVAAQAGETPAVEGSAPVLGKMAVFAIGRCEDARLGQAVRAIRSELRLQQGAAMLSEDDTARPAGGLHTMSLEEVHKTINEGRTQFFGLDYGTAEATLLKVLPDIDRLTPGPERWAAAVLARIEVAHVSMFNQKPALADEMLFDVVRLQEDLKLDRHLYPPLLRDELEKVRRSVQKARRFKLRVSSAEREQLVFINGKELGKTPFERSLVEGSYEVIVGDPPAHSFLRRLDLRADTDLPAVEVAPESRLKAQAGPCYEAEPVPEERSAAAALLASALRVDQVAMVRLEKAAADAYAGATIYDVALGREVRDGRQRFDSDETPRLKKLARYLLTGDRSLLDEPPPGAPILKLPTSATSAATDSRAQRASFPWLRAGGIALGAVAVGLGFLTLAENTRAEVARNERERILTEPGLMSRDRASAADSASRRYYSAALWRSALTLGTVATAAGSCTMVGLSMNRGLDRADAGASLVVAGTFP